MSKSIYSTLGFKEGYVDELYRITEANATTLNLIKESNKLTAKTLNWTERFVSRPGASGAYEDGTAIGSAFDATTQEIVTYMEQVVVPIEVSKATEEIAKKGGLDAGKISEIKEATQDALARVKQYENYDIINATGAAGGGGTPAKMRGLIDFASTYTGNVTDLAGANISASESNFVDLVHDCANDGIFVKGKEGSVVAIINPTTKTVINANWTGVANNTDTFSKDGKIYNRVEYYVSDWGVVVLIMDEDIPNTEIVVFNKEEAERRYLYKDVQEVYSSILGKKFAAAVGVALKYSKPRQLGRLHNFANA